MRRCTTHGLYRSKLWQQDHCQHPSKCKSGLPRITGDVPRAMKTKFRATVMVLVGFQVRATSCHLTSWKSAWKSTPRCTWMSWRVWWSPGAIRWPVADTGLASEREQRLCTLLSLAPLLPDLNPLDYFVWSYVGNITNMTFENTKASLIAAIRRAPAGACGKGMLQFRIRIEAVIEAEGGYIE